MSEIETDSGEPRVLGSRDGYVLLEGAPTVSEYRTLRAVAGLSPKREDQAAAAIAGSWSFVHVRAGDGALAAMGRVIGDGGWYFHVADMATHPDHQRRGLGAWVLQRLVAEIEARAPDGPFVSLIADPPGQRLYRSAGFRETTPAIAMGLIPGRSDEPF